MIRAQKIRINQFHFHASPGDAITNQMLMIREALRSEGIESDIYAREIKPDLINNVMSYHRVPLWNSDLLLIHHSQGNPLLRELLRLEIPKAVVYHNITPAHYLSHDEHVAALCRMGRQQLHLFRDRCIASFADSRYNAADLEAAGITGTEILPVVPLSLWKTAPTIAKKKMDLAQGIHLLFVGRMIPHKNQALALETLFCLKKLVPHSRLTLVGGEDRVYGKYLHDLCRVLKLEKAVSFKSRLSQEELGQIYAEGDAFLCLSQHEGFGIPLVEAMLMKLPVFSFTHTAMSETLGDAGVQLRTEMPSEIAGILATVLGSREAVEAILRGQAQQLQHLREQQNPGRIVDLILPLVESLRAKRFSRPVTQLAPQMQPG